MKGPFRTKSIKIRINDDEHQRLLERMQGAELATWMRQTCLDQQPQRAYKPVDPDLLRHLARMGANLNQIARVINYDAKAGSIDVLRVLGELSAIREQLNQVLQLHDR